MSFDDEEVRQIEAERYDVEARGRPDAEVEKLFPYLRTYGDQCIGARGEPPFDRDETPFCDTSEIRVQDMPVERVDEYRSWSVPEADHAPDRAGLGHVGVNDVGRELLEPAAKAPEGANVVDAHSASQTCDPLDASTSIAELETALVGLGLSHQERRLETSLVEVVMKDASMPGGSSDIHARDDARHVHLVRFSFAGTHRTSASTSIATGDLQFAGASSRALSHNSRLRRVQSL